MSIALNEKNKAKNDEPYAHSLDAINFLLADVRGALGPYLNVFLVTQQHLEPVASGHGDNGCGHTGSRRANTNWWHSQFIGLY